MTVALHSVIRSPGMKTSNQKQPTSVYLVPGHV